MISRYKEIWFGIFFGLGAILIDVVMHSQMSNRGVLQELFDLRGEMVIYRALFMGFGFGTGWLMWRNSRREREFRDLQQRFHGLQGQISPLITVTYAHLQMALTRTGNIAIPPELAAALQALQEDVRRLKSAISSQEV